MKFIQSIIHLVDINIPLSIYKIKTIVRGFLFKNTMWMTFGLVGRTLLQIIYFIVVARTLKPDAYGLFAGSLAIVTVLSPFVSWGTGNILVKNVSRYPEQFRIYWGIAFSISIITSLILCVLGFLISFLTLSLSSALKLVLPMSIGVFLGEGFATLSGYAFLAFQKIKITALINILLGFSRCLFAFLLVWLPISKAAENWALLYMFSGLVCGIIGITLVYKKIGWGPLGITGMKGKWKEGLYFSIGLSSQGVYNDIDKTILVRYVSDSVGGLYTAAYRLMDASFIPVRALLAATYTRFFIKGQNGIGETTKFALRLLPWAVGSGLFATFGLFVCSPLLPILLGKEYELTSKILLWLSLIPLFRAIQYLAADSLTGAGYQKFRSIFQIGLAFFNFVLNLWWIPKFGWLGAAWSSLISDGLLAIIFWCTCLIIARKQKMKIFVEY